MNPLDVLVKLCNSIHFFDIMNHRKKPGEAIMRLSDDQREALKRLTSDEAKNVRLDGWEL